MQSVELNVRRWGWTEFRLGSWADITVDLAVRNTHVQYGADLLNFSRCLEDVQDSAYPKDT
jgi:hypothetical protein